TVAQHGTRGPGAGRPAARVAGPGTQRQRWRRHEEGGNAMSAANGRQGILSLAVKDKAGLYNAYMPYVRHGGIFVPTPKRYFLGDEVFLLLTLPDSSDRLPIAGKVRSEERRAGPERT